MAKKNILYIHGAWSTNAGFNYINISLSLLAKDEIAKVVFLEYDSIAEVIEDIVDRGRKKLRILSSNGLDTVIIAHSLGGIIALALENEPNVSRVVTLASPIGGLHLNKFYHFWLLYNNPILKEAIETSYFIKDLKAKVYTKPISILAAYCGYNPFINEPSDGVVTIRSQTEWTPDTSFVTKIQSNHHEILQHSDTLKIIQKILKDG